MEEQNDFSRLYAIRNWAIEPLCKKKPYKDLLKQMANHFVKFLSVLPCECNHSAVTPVPAKIGIERYTQPALLLRHYSIALAIPTHILPVEIIR